MPMYCKQCGNSIAEGARFCPACGTPTVVYPKAASRQLIRPRAGRIIAGVCQGIANQYAWDAAWVRVLAVIATVFGGGLGAVAYLVLWVVTPEEPLSLPPGQSYTPSS
jgi:phage shock protein C